MKCPYCSRPVDRTGRNSRAVTCGRPRCKTKHRKVQRSGINARYRQKQSQNAAAQT